MRDDAFPSPSRTVHDPHGVRTRFRLNTPPSPKATLNKERADANTHARSESFMQTSVHPNMRESQSRRNPVWRDIELSGK
eukprot:6313520-Prymnesium_polylepis.1